MLSARTFLVLLVTALLAGLAPAADADPPDPTWIGGFWDDDDFDTVVVYIANTAAILAAAGVDVEPFLISIARVEPAGPDFIPTHLRSDSHPRAPPVSSSSHC